MNLCNFSNILSNWQMPVDWKIFFGWLLGLLTVIFTSTVNDYRRTVRVRRGIKAELWEARIIVASAICSIARKVQLFDEDLLKWFKTEIGAYKAQRGGKIDEMLIELENLPDDKLKEIASAFNSKAPESASIPPIELAYTKASVPDIALLSPEVQRHIFGALRFLHVANEKIKQIDHWEKYTFTSPKDGNYERAVMNSHSAMIAFVKSLKRASSHVADALQLL